MTCKQWPNSSVISRNAVISNTPVCDGNGWVSARSTSTAFALPPGSFHPFLRLVVVLTRRFEEKAHSRLPNVDLVALKAGLRECEFRLMFGEKRCTSQFVPFAPRALPHLQSDLLREEGKG